MRRFAAAYWIGLLVAVATGISFAGGFGSAQGSAGAVTGSDGTPAEVSASGQLHVVMTSMEDVNNTTTGTLANGATFTGTATDVRDFSAINVNVFADQDSAASGLSVQVSSDGTNWDNTDDYSYFASTGKTYNVQPSSVYLRVLYTNGSVTQGAFRLSTMLHKVAVTPSVHRIGAPIVADDDGQLVIAVLKGQKPDLSYANVDVTAGENLKTSLEELESTISVNSNTQLRVTQYDAAGNETTRSFDETHYLSAYVTSVGSMEMAVDGTAGSGGSLTFSYEVPVGKKFVLGRALTSLQDGASVFAAGDFGEISGALANGVQVIVDSAGTETVLENWTTNIEIRDTMFDFDLAFGASPPDGSYSGRWTFGKDLDNGGINMSAGDLFKVRIRDNLAALTSFTMKIKGRLEDE